MLMVRLQRIGKRGQAYFRIVVLEHTTRPKGKYLELLGSYNPHQKEFKAKKDRIEYWVSKGAQVSPTVNNLLVNYKVWDKPKMKSWKPKKKEEVVKNEVRGSVKIEAKVEESKGTQVQEQISQEQVQEMIVPAGN